MLYPPLFYTEMDKKIKNIGTIQGKVLLFGGVYSNLQALKELISIASEEGISPENCISTGDIVGYCAQPEETLKTFQIWGAQSIQGNVEQQLFEGAVDCGCDFTAGSRCDGFSKKWYPYAQSKLSKASISWMGALPDHITFEFAGKLIAVVHGAFDYISEFIFASSPTTRKEQNFLQTESDIIVAGHSGMPFHQEIDDKLWLNPGVIGMPANDGTPRVWYVILEEINGKLKYTHRYLTYDHQTTYELMREHHLPLEYAETLLSGLWDNMEILPEAEKKLQGIPLTFQEKEKIHLKS